MLGPRGYQTRIVASLSLPHGLPDDCLAALIGFQPSHLLELEIWRRLFATEFIERREWSLILFGLSHPDQKAALAMLPPSVHDRLHCLPDESQAWRTAFEGQSVVVFPLEKTAMLGPANEEAWDEAQALFRSSLSRRPEEG